MKVLICSLLFLIVTVSLSAQHDPVLSESEQQAVLHEYDITRMLKIGMKRTYLLEISNGELTGRKALVSEQYFNDDGTPSQLINFDSTGNKANYSLFRFDRQRSKTEEIYFDADSSLRGGFIAEYDSSHLTTAHYYYNQKAEIVSKQLFSYDYNKHVVSAQLFNSAGKLSSVRSYRFSNSVTHGKILSVSTSTPDNQAIDSIAFVYNEEAQVSEKLFFDGNHVLLQKMEYFYNDAGALIKTIETNRITRQVRELSYTYDAFENPDSIIESIDRKTTAVYKFEYFSKTGAPK